MESYFAQNLARTAIILALTTTCSWGAPRQADMTWTCPQVPQLCFPPTPVPPNQCSSDKDCKFGARCCYSGCTKKCDMPDPCQKVICEDGYLCQTQETSCPSPPCQLEAVCLPETQVLCESPTCATEECEPGYQHAKDNSGCPKCECVKVKDCEPTCNIFCADGYVTGEAGCPTCKCKEAASNPCSHTECGKNEECRLVKVECIKAPCQPVPMCMEVLPALYENRCSMTDKTTVGLPVIFYSLKTEIDCNTDLCPDGSVCTTLGKGIHRCCWQASQKTLMSSPKAGECPQDFMLNYDAMTIKCEIDSECPGEQKCCYKRLNVERSLQYGYCMDTIDKIVANATEECNRSPLLRMVFSQYGLC